ncbi:MAG: phosphatase PAP2 family protein [Cytophagaceae bacterium]|nr:phosphatase PAP2 family protein [Cytophagaceae bacterium]
MEQLLAYDSQLFEFLNSLGSSRWDGFWRVISYKLSAIPLYALLLYGIYKVYGLKNLLITIVIVALLITCVDQLANLFKYGIQRPRPCRVDALSEHIRFVAARCGRYGFFSAHAANSMAAAVFAGLALRSRYPNVIFVLLFWAAMVGYSRIYLGVHYPGDVLVGWTIGAIFGYLFFRLQQFLIRKYGTI